MFKPGKQNKYMGKRWTNERDLWTISSGQIPGANTLAPGIWPHINTLDSYWITI